MSGNIPIINSDKHNINLKASVRKKENLFIWEFVWLKFVFSKHRHLTEEINYDFFKNMNDLCLDTIS